MLLSQGSTWVLSILVLILAPRHLGDADFGKAFVAVTFVSFFELFADFGTATYVTKMVARDPESVGHLVANLAIAKLIWAVFLAVAAVGLSMVLGYDHTLVALVALAGLAMVFTTLNGSLTGGLNGLQRMGGVAVAGVLQKVIFTVIGVSVLLKGWGVVWYTAVGPVAMLLQLVLTSWAFWRYRPPHFRFDPALIRRSVVGGLPFFAAASIVMIYGKIDVPLLERMANARTVGWYSLAYQWVSMPAFFAMTVMSAVFPSLSARGTSLGPGFAIQANKALRLVSMVGVPVATGIALVSAEGIDLVYTGRGYERAVPVIGILAAHLPVVSVTIVLSMSIAAADRKKVWLLVGVVAAVVNIGLNLVAIPWTVTHFDNGAIGAAAVTVLTEATIMVGAIVLRPAGVLDRATAGYLVRCVVASMSMVGPVIYLADSLLAKVVVGAVVFGAFAIILGVVSPRQVVRALGQVRGSVTRTT